MRKLIDKALERGYLHKALGAYGVVYFGAMIYLCVVKPLYNFALVLL